MKVCSINRDDTAETVLCDTPLSEATIRRLPAGSTLESDVERRIEVVICVIQGQLSLTADQAQVQLGKMQGTQIPAGQGWSAVAGQAGATVLQVKSLHPGFDPGRALMPALPTVHLFDIADGQKLVYTDYVRGGVLNFGPRFAADKHFHQDADELFWFLSGTCRVGSADGEVVVASGNIIYIPPGEWHIIANAGDEPLLMFVTVTPNIVPSHTFFKPDGTLYARSMAPLTKP